MKNTIKMSLVAAVAVAGLTSTATAGSLEAAIKDTTLSGYVRARVNTDHTNESVQGTELKAVYNFKSKVNDVVTAHVKFVGKYTDGETPTGINVPNFDINQANFIMKTDYATMIAGLQTTQSPFFANNGDTRANGITALIPAGPATIAAAHYTNVTPYVLSDSEDVTALALIGSAGGVNLEAWYATAAGTDIDAMAFLASTEISGVGIAAHYADVDNGTSAEIDNLQIAVSGKAGEVSLMAAYAKTGEQSGNVTFDNDTDSKLIFSLEGLADTRAADVDAFVVGASMPVGPVTAGITYMDGETGSTDFDEVLVEASYKMSKNFKISGFYSSSELGTADNENSRVELKYSF